MGDVDLGVYARQDTIINSLNLVVQYKVSIRNPAGMRRICAAIVSTGW